ncbi:hypothetical protein SAMN05421595_2050 [Austwickia chelonae]|uniref:DUF3109 family protein n=1 Tax=Austwickia chelonae NBRC 105200 TaxID=1184607 RepID=K6VJJ8_9MICO|nr:hypothetical protein [Austwickia chelonae]GAB76914.1 hypothetical protein AUCHE_03_01310 [Austwickia chelonae NBRC 105200]SEW32299.1 hypothetical protein SAMN05421595_2050 [Austwickia chelonae]
MPSRSISGPERSAETPLDPPRLWIEFPDPEGAEQRFRCDLTWLTSRYRCIFGQGCLGIDENIPEYGCCTLGAHFTDAEDLDRVRAVVAELDDRTWQLRGSAPGDTWWEDVEDDEGTDEEPEVKTRVVDGACVLFNRPDHPAGAGCALHQYALARGIAPHTVKPDVCWQLPIRRTYRTITLPDDTSYLEVSIGEYDRRGWGPGGHDLDWYCTGSPLAHRGTVPLYLGAADELIELMGEPAYLVLREQCEAHLSAGSGGVDAGGRPHLPLSVHPATREACRP